MAEGEAACFNLEDVIIDDATWEDNNLIVRVVDSDPQQQVAGDETASHVIDFQDDDTSNEESHGQPETAVRVIDESAAMDVLEYVDKSKNHNTRSAEKTVSHSVSYIRFLTLYFLFEGCKSL